MIGFIDESIIIDFEIPKTLENTLQEAEQLYKENNIEYINVVDIIDVLCKEAYSCNQISKEQWNLILDKYQI